MDRSRRARGAVYLDGSGRPFVAAALVALAAILGAPLLPSTPLPPGQADAANPRPRDCPKRIGKARFQQGKETVFGRAENLIDLSCAYYLRKGDGRSVASVQSIRLRYWTGEPFPPHGDHPTAEPYCWRASTTGSVATEPADGQALTPLEAAIGAPETKTNAGRAGVIYPIGDRFIWARYSASRKELRQVRKAVIELAASLAHEPAVGIAMCPQVEPVTSTAPTEIDPVLDEMDPAAMAYLAVVERFLERVAEADQMELDAIDPRDLIATDDALGAASLAHAEAAEDFAAELSALPVPPYAEAERDALIELAEQEADLWQIMASEAPLDFDEAWSNSVARAQDELFLVTPAREDADALLRALLGLE